MYEDMDYTEGTIVIPASTQVNEQFNFFPFSAFSPQTMQFFFMINQTYIFQRMYYITQNIQKYIIT